MIPQLVRSPASSTYGFSPQADIRAVNLKLGRDGARFDVVIADAR